jgi:hypothetical protein
MLQRLNDTAQVPSVLVLKPCSEALWRKRFCSVPTPPDYSSSP